MTPQEVGVGVPLSFGDYFFVEALVRYANHTANNMPSSTTTSLASSVITPSPIKLAFLKSLEER